jgi:sigma-B regulation protein RsbU (phosphoserine phosphatase)
MGPNTGTHTVKAGESTVIGRLPFSDLCLLHEGVSRRHALISAKGAQWYLTDQGSSAGTFLNGVKLRANEPVPLSEGDLLRVGPWTFRLTIGSVSSENISRTIDDSGAAGGTNAKLSKVGGESGESISLVGRRLRLLTQCIAKLSAAREESALGPIALEMVMSGTPFGRGALIQAPKSEAEAVIVLASRRANTYDTAPLTFSRSLIQTCVNARGTFVLTESSQPVSSMSIIEMTIHSAICAPVMLGEELWGLLYLDARAGEQSVQQEAAEFCEAVATALGLSLAALKRTSLELRQHELTSELNAAREVQETITPPPQGHIGCVNFAVRVLPGVFVAGDMFDCMEVEGNRVAFFLGDVAGHGAGSGMLMAMVQSHLTALLRATGDLLGSVRAANHYLATHITAGRFASLFAGIIEPDGLLRYVDAGHGHWFLRRENGTTLCAAPIATRGGVPLGISTDAEYEEGRLMLCPGDRVVMYSDGAVEQRNSSGEYFSVNRLHALVATSRCAPEDVSRVFADLLTFAATDKLDDDATLASLEFRSAAT